MDDKILRIDNEIVGCKHMLSTVCRKRYPIGLRLMIMICKRWGPKPYEVTKNSGGVIHVARLNRVSASARRRHIEFDPARHAHRLLNETESCLV